MTGYTRSAVTVRVAPGEPVEGLWLQVIDGDITIEQAEKAAAALRPDEHRLPLRMLPVVALYLVRAAPFLWAPRALMLCRIIDAALAGVDGGHPLAELRARAGGAFAATASHALAMEPDGDLFARADAAARWGLAWARRLGADTLRVELLTWLGELHARPYTWFRPHESYADADRRWRDLEATRSDAYYRYEELRPEGEELAWTAVGHAAGRRKMPGPRESLRASAGFLREALGERDDPAIAALLCDTLLYQRLVGDVAEESELRRLWDTALSGTSYEDGLEPAARVALCRHVHTGQAVPSELTACFTEDTLWRYANEYGAFRAVAAVHAIVRCLGPTEPERGYALLSLAGTMLAQSGVEGRWDEVRREHLLLDAMFIPWLRSDHWRGRSQADDAAFTEFARRIPELPPREGVVAVVLSVMGAYPLTASGELAAQLWKGLDLASQLDPELFAVHADAFAAIRMELRLGLAHHLAGTDPGAAAQAYAEALQEALRLDLPGEVGQALRGVADTVASADWRQCGEVLALLLKADFRRAMDHAGVSRLHADLCRRLIGMLVHHQLHWDLVLAALHLAKGYDFASALTAGPPALADVLPTGRRLLERVAAAAAALPDHVFAADPPGADAFDEYEAELILAGWSDAESGERAAVTPLSLLRRRQRLFDRHVHEGLRHSHGHVPPVWGRDDLCRRLDARSALLICTDYIDHAGNPAMLFMLLTRDGARADRVFWEFGGAEMTLGEGAARGSISPLHLGAVHVRRDLLDDPGPGAVPEAAARSLADGKLYFGEVAGWLEELHVSGHDRLWISTQGALHFFPYHLTGPAGMPLAQRWAVAQLPHLTMLTRPPAPVDAQRRPGARRAEVTSFGMSYRGDPREELPVLADAPDEAVAVAAAFGGRALLEDQVTKREVLAALRASTRVHLAVHGRHQVEAPMFQHLVLAGTGEQGRLCAYELLDLDLSGLELVTLSSCETALGRFDRRDNFYGLPAVLLQAGVRSIVGALWPVRTDAAAAFFPELYRTLARGEDLMSAYAAAQRHTRALFPAYRDWGAFQLMGGVPQ